MTSKNIIILWLVFFAHNVNASSYYLESMPSEATTYTSGGWVLRDVGFIGIRFDVAEDVHITGLLGNLGGSGNFFGAIDRIVAGNNLPSVSPGFNSTDVLA